jgi:hypothetical protein
MPSIDQFESFLHRRVMESDTNLHSVSSNMALIELSLASVLKVLEYENIPKEILACLVKRK